MNRIQPFHGMRWIPLAWSCVHALSCVVESAPEELGAVQFNRGQSVAARPTGAITSSTISDAPVRDSKPDNPSTAPTTGTQMAPAAPAGSAAGAPATPPKAQDMAPAKPSTPAAGAASTPVAGAGALAGSRAAAAGTGAAPPGDPGGTTEPPPDSPAEPSGPGMLTVSFTSVGPGGRYAPRNCGAVWIEDASGKFIKTIERWTAIRERYLEAWSMASGGWGFSIFGGSTGGDNPDQVDVVSAGTLSRHQMHKSTWNMKNVDGEVVPDGMYTVVVEVSEGTSGVGRVEFVKGPMAQMLDGKSSVFADMKVIYSR